MKYKILIVFILLISACSSPKQMPIEEPAHQSDEDYYQHFAYSLVYDEAREQALWVAYELNESELEKLVSRTNNFKEDTAIRSGSAVSSDYKHSGYDRGHLAPAADMVWNEQAMNESFLYSNMSPQLPAFNRGIWKRLESKVRSYAKTYGTIYIATGPLCNGSDSTIGANNVCVPTAFYKAILVYNDTLQQSIGFLIPHRACMEDIFQFSMTIDSLEQISTLDFFSALPDRREKEIEAVLNTDFWER